MGITRYIAIKDVDISEIVTTQKANGELTTNIKADLKHENKDAYKCDLRLYKDGDKDSFVLAYFSDHAKVCKYCGGLLDQNGKHVCRTNKGYETYSGEAAAAMIRMFVLDLGYNIVSI